MEKAKGYYTFCLFLYLLQNLPVEILCISKIMKYSIYKFTLSFTFILLIGGLAFAQTEDKNGIDLYNQGDFKGAVESLQKSVESDKKDRNSRLFLGMALARQNQIKNAVKVFQEASELKIDEPIGDDKKIKIVAKPRAAYTDSARENGTQGTIKLAVEFGVDGKIKSIVPFQILPNGLTRSTIDAVRKIRFEPAVKSGKPITSIEIIEYNFVIY